jgi:uncharacterized membrane protein
MRPVGLAIWVRSMGQDKSDSTHASVPGFLKLISRMSGTLSTRIFTCHWNGFVYLWFVEKLSEKTDPTECLFGGQAKCLLVFNNMLQNNFLSLTHTHTLTNMLLSHLLNQFLFLFCFETGSHYVSCLSLASWDYRHLSLCLPLI